MARKGKSTYHLAELTPPSDDHLRILKVISRIPRGRLMSYGEVARKAGLPGRARLVGRLLAGSPMADQIPWHRVVNSSGRISLRGGDGPRRQRELLAAERVLPDKHGKFDLEKYRITNKG